MTDKQLHAILAHKWITFDQFPARTACAACGHFSDVVGLESECPGQPDPKHPYYLRHKNPDTGIINDWERTGHPSPVRYVCGFVMNAVCEVLLLRKAKPEWQAGKLNGVGGKVEPHDATLRDAMAREFYEETGIATRSASWCHFHTESWRYQQGWEPGAGDVEVYFFYTFDYVNMSQACANTIRGAEPCSVHHFHTPQFMQDDQLIYNIPYLCLMAEQHHRAITGLSNTGSGARVWTPYAGMEV